MNGQLDWRDGLDEIDWRELSALYLAAPLGHKDPDDLRTVFGNSRYRCFVDDGQRLIGAGRALADGVDGACVCDVAVHPSHQGMGLGKALATRFTELSKHHKKIILYAVAGKEPFYRKLGFRRMKTAMAIFANPALAMAQGLLDGE